MRLIRPAVSGVQRPHAPARTFSLMHEDEEASEDFMEGNSISGSLARCLFDSGSMHSFICTEPTYRPRTYEYYFIGGSTIGSVSGYRSSLQGLCSLEEG